MCAYHGALPVGARKLPLVHVLELIGDTHRACFRFVVVLGLGEQEEALREKNRASGSHEKFQVEVALTGAHTKTAGPAGERTFDWNSKRGRRGVLVHFVRRTSTARRHQQRIAKQRGRVHRSPGTSVARSCEDTRRGRVQFFKKTKQNKT